MPNQKQNIEKIESLIAELDFIVIEIQSDMNLTTQKSRELRTIIVKIVEIMKEIPNKYISKYMEEVLEYATNIELKKIEFNNENSTLLLKASTALKKLLKLRKKKQKALTKKEFDVSGAYTISEKIKKVEVKEEKIEIVKKDKVSVKNIVTEVKSKVEFLLIEEEGNEKLSKETLLNILSGMTEIYEEAKILDNKYFLDYVKVIKMYVSGILENRVDRDKEKIIIKKYFKVLAEIVKKEDCQELTKEEYEQRGYLELEEKIKDRIPFDYKDNFDFEYKVKTVSQEQEEDEFEKDTVFEEIKEPKEELQRVLILQMKGVKYAIELKRVKDITTVPNFIIKLPNTKEELIGMINSRGEVIPLIDIKQRFGIRTDENMCKITDKMDRKNIVVSIISEEGKKIGIILDELINFETVDFKQAVETNLELDIPNIYIKHMLSYKEDILVVFNIDEMFNEEYLKSTLI